MSGQTYYLNKGYHTLSTSLSSLELSFHWEWEFAGVFQHVLFVLIFFGCLFLFVPATHMNTYTSTLLRISISEILYSTLYCCHSFTFYLQPKKRNEMNRHLLKNNGSVIFSLNMWWQLYRRHCHCSMFIDITARSIRVSVLNEPKKIFSLSNGFSYS